MLIQWVCELLHWCFFCTTYQRAPAEPYSWSSRVSPASWRHWVCERFPATWHSTRCVSDCHCDFDLQPDSRSHSDRWGIHLSWNWHRVERCGGWALVRLDHSSKENKRYDWSSACSWKLDLQIFYSNISYIRTSSVGFESKSVEDTISDPVWWAIFFFFYDI